MMLACRSRPCLIPALRFLARTTSTSPSPSTSTSPSASTDKPQDSIFTAPESPWDHVFSDLEPVPPVPPPSRLPAGAGTISPTSPARKPGHATFQANPHFLQRASTRRRASITAHEMKVFDEMFDLIFDAISKKDKGKKSTSFTPSLASPVGSSSQTPSIDGAGGALNGLFRTLRRHTSRVRWTTAIDEELDRKKEAMELFTTDHDLLQWVIKELFGEVEQWDEEAKRVIAASNAKEAGKGIDPTDTATSSSSPTSETPKEHTINHSIYPHLIAHAMRIFRTTYSNPSLSLAIFNHASQVSIASYVFGCTAPAYNELIEAKWQGWGDLEGVCNALEEMRANGVKVDGRTRIVVERIRREVGEARPVEHMSVGLDDAEQVNLLARRVWVELGEGEVMKLVHRIERLALRERSRKTTSSPHEESWKTAVLKPSGEDGWSFDGWDEEKTKKQRYTRTLGEWSTSGPSEEGMAFR